VYGLHSSRKCMKQSKKRKSRVFWILKNVKNVMVLTYNRPNDHPQSVCCPLCSYYKAIYISINNFNIMLYVYMSNCFRVMRET